MAALAGHRALRLLSVCTWTQEEEEKGKKRKKKHPKVRTLQRTASRSSTSSCSRSLVALFQAMCRKQFFFFHLFSLFQVFLRLDLAGRDPVLLAYFSAECKYSHHHCSRGLFCGAALRWLVVPCWSTAEALTWRRTPGFL